MKLEDRLMRSVKKRSGNVILRSDLASLGSASQLSEALKALQRRGLLVRIGTGIYAKTRVSTVTGAVIPAGTLESLSQEAFARMGVSVSAGRASAEYNAGRTTLVPGKLVVNTGKRRIQRKISVGGRRLAYENDYT
jgi:predicted transcriptional regulator of viral defense system